MTTGEIPPAESDRRDPAERNEGERREEADQEESKAESGVPAS
jgi:hypothetical protein